MEGFGSFNTQGVSVNARHFFGVNTSVKDSLYLVGDDNTLLYVAGHNIVLFRLDEREQQFMAGKLFDSAPGPSPSPSAILKLFLARVSN